MTDFFYWGGPVYCKQANELVWRRETKVFCNPLEGVSNANYFYTLGPRPLDALFAKAKLDPAQVGSVGFGGFSAYGQLIGPILKVPECCERVDYVHLADACFTAPGATKAAPGYACFARRATEGKCRMTVTTNGPWGKDISYWGPKGSKYEGVFFHLSSGQQCFDLVWKEVVGAYQGDPEVPAGVSAPTRAFRKGELYWFHYEGDDVKDSHGRHVGELSRPYMQLYGVPWMGGERGGAGAGALAVAAVFGVAGYLGAKYYLES